MILIVFLLSGLWFVYRKYYDTKYVIRSKWFDYLFVSRIAGTLAYFYYAYYISDGSVDAFIYDNWGELYASYFRAFDFSPFFDASLYRNAQFFGAHFVGYPTAIFLIITFDDILSTYYLYSLIALSGIILFIKGIARSCGYYLSHVSLKWFLLIPSLWFWNSTIGKDAFTILGIGCLFFYLNEQKFKKRLIGTLIGVGIIFMFRPQFAFLMVLAFGISVLLGSSLKWWKKISLGLVAFLGLLFLMPFINDLSHLSSLSVNSINSTLETLQHQTDFGSGQIAQKNFSVGGVIQALIDVFARPFLWEARSITYLIAATETLLILFLLYQIFKSRYLKIVKKNIVFQFLLVSALVFGLAIGITEVNLGTIARHRSIVHLMIVGAFVFLESNRERSENYARKSNVGE